MHQQAAKAGLRAEADVARVDAQSARTRLDAIQEEVCLHPTPCNSRSVLSHQHGSAALPSGTGAETSGAAGEAAACGGRSSPAEAAGERRCGGGR